MKVSFGAIILFVFSSVFAETKTVEIPFYNKKHSVLYDNSIVVEFPYKPNDDGYFEIYYQRFDTTLYEDLLKSLQAIKQDLRLNDWLYFQLLKKSIDAIFPSQKEHFRNLFLWFMLNKSNYDVRLEFKGKDITVSVFSYDLVYGVPQSKGKGGYYIDLTSFNNQIDYQKWEPFRVEFNPNKKVETIPFSFTIKELPKVFESKIVEKEIVFSHNEKDFKVKIPIESGYVDFLKDYPELSVLKHTEIALSPKAYDVLILFLKEQTSGMDSIQTMRFLLSFCRTGFNFKKSEIKEMPYVGTAGQKIIFAPEETLLASSVDSEDISVLFYFLAKEIMNPQMVLLKYGKEVSVAVFLHKKIGTPIIYENKPFSLCDPVGPDDSADVGEAPKTLMGKYPSFLEK